MIDTNHHRYKKRKFQRKFTLLLLFFIFLSSPASLAGKSYYYYIEKDENGFFIQTENDGSYYLDTQSVPDDLRAGQKGRYKLVTEDHGSYLVTTRHGKFLIDSATIESSRESLDISNSHKITRIVINGRQILVPVTINNGSKKVQAILLLDTGATTVALHSDLAQKLRLKPQKKAMVEVAGGKKIEMGVSVLSSIKVGSIEKKDISVCIIDSLHGSKAYQGLLGMNFLGDVNYRIDIKKQLMIWE
jgi:clan AA aspartic protease (TIGR02281 family)